MLLRIIVLLITVLIAANAAGNDRDLLTKEEQLLEAELSLARKTNIYFVFNLGEKKIQIKAKGTLLKELPIKGVESWGSGTPGDALSLEKKSAFIEPDRGKIKPGDNKDTDTFEMDALEVDDMPARYTLVFDQGVRISVKPAPDGFFSKIGNILTLFKRALVRPFLTFFYAVRGKPFTAIDIELEKNDAKALYWSLSEGAGTILYPQ